MNNSYTKINLGIFRNNCDSEMVYGLTHIFKSDSDNIYIEKKEEKKTLFVNLFGLCVNYLNGDIVIGQYLNQKTYLKAGNIYKLISAKFFGSNKIPNYVNVGGIIEPMKVNAKTCVNTIRNNVIKDYKERNNKNCKSITMALINKSKNDIDIDSHSELSYFINNFNESILIDVVNTITGLYYGLLDISLMMFDNFSLENSYQEVLENMDNLKKNKLLSLKGLNKSAITCFNYYLNNGIDDLFLLSFYSYKIGMPVGKTLKKRVNDYYVYYLSKDKKFNRDNFYDSVSKLSFPLYLKDDEKSLISYNILDLVHSIEETQSLIFSIDYLKSKGTDSLIKLFIKQKDIQTLCDNNNIDIERFISISESYIEKILPTLDKFYLPKWQNKVNKLDIGNKYMILNNALILTNNELNSILSKFK